MKTQPWQLTEQIAGEFRMLEDLLKRQVLLEVEIENQRYRIKQTTTKALEAFAEELSGKNATNK